MRLAFAAACRSWSWSIVGLCCALAASPAVADPLTMTWRTHVQSPDLLTGEFERLYEALVRFYDAGVSVPTQRVPLAGRTPEQALADARQTYGVVRAGTPLVYACRLNPKVCSVSDGTAHWRLDAGAQINLPAIPFAQYSTFESYHASLAESLSAIVVDKQQGCVTLDNQCQQLLALLNPGQPNLANGPEGDIVVPSLNYYASIDLSGTTVPGALSDTGQVIASFRSAAASGDALQRRKGNAYLDAIKPILTALVGVSGFAEQSAGAGTPQGDAIERRHTLLGRTIHSSWTPNRDEELVHVPVAVLDGRIDDLDCDFEPRQVTRWLTLQAPDKEAPIDRSPDGSCDAGLVAAPGILQHGTHVAGIIAAKPEAAIGPGVYPFARINSYEVVIDGASGKFMATVAALSRELLIEQPRVLNISAAYTKEDPQSADPFAQDLLRSRSPLSQGTLFVAAAGNQGVNVSEAHRCVYFPACYSRDHANVMAVIALDDDGEVAKFENGQSSNFGEAFDIGAPGVNVPSSAPGDLMAVMSGTSQAAPIVSGAAAHVFALRSGARPGEVKERLIYTSDLLPGLRGKVLGGRLNVDAATVDIDYDVVKLVNGSVLRGTASTSDVILRFRVANTRDVRRVGLSDVRRLARRGDANAWDLFLVERAAAEPTLNRYAVMDVDFLKVGGGEEVRHSSFDLARDQDTLEVNAENLGDYVVRMGY